MSDITNEKLILSSLVQNEQYARKVIPFLKDEYFEDLLEKRLFEIITGYVEKYNGLPNKTDLSINIRNDSKLNEEQTDEALSLAAELFDIEPANNQEWLVTTTESFCQDKAVYNAIHQAIAIYQGEDKQLTPHAIPDLLKNAIAVCFDSKVGIDFFDDAESRFDFYATPESKIPFHLNILNEVTCGGVTPKTLNLLVAGVNVGKTLGLIDLAAGYMRDGKNVLYISMEMREEMIMQRVDANMLKVPVNDVASLGKERFMNRIEVLKQKSYGKLKVKEFPPGMASAVHIRHVVDELKLKQGFVPDIIMVDYLQIAASSRMKYGQVGSYYYYKSVAEELRALAVELNVVIWSAAQFNRGGMNATEVGMEDIAESTGIAMTADGMWGLIRTDELDAVGQIMWKQLKSRYANKAVRTRFVTGVDVEKQCFYDVDQNAQPELSQPEQAKPMTGQQLKERFLGMQ